jgi:ATP-dependent Clp protease ATP-binding subunit ClpC
MAERDLQLDLTEPMKDLLVEQGWDPAMGARPLRRAIQRYVEDPLADFVLRNSPEEGSTVMVERAPEEDEREVALTVIAPEKQPEPKPVAVGAEGGEAEDEPASEPEGDDAAPDAPAE